LYTKERIEKKTFELYAFKEFLQRQLREPLITRILIEIQDMSKKLSTL